MTDKSDTIEARIIKKLHAAFSPTELEVINESHLHAGHQEAFDGSGETHFRVRLASEKFDGMTRLARHRAVNEILADELADGVHALAVEPRAPGGASRR